MTQTLKTSLKAMVVVFTTGLVTALLAGAANATNLHAQLNGSEEIPAVATPGTGDATFVLDDVTNQLEYTLNYSGLLGPTTAAHLHRGSVGQNGPVVYTLAVSNFPNGLEGTVQIDPADVPLLLNQGFYCNIHTEAYPGGEVRGQVRVTGTPVEGTTWGEIKDLFR